MCGLDGACGSSSTSNIQIPPITTPASAPAIGGIFRLFDTLMPKAAKAAGDIIDAVGEVDVWVLGKCRGDSITLMSLDSQ